MPRTSSNGELFQDGPSTKCPNTAPFVEGFLAAAVIGGPDTVRQGLQALVQATQADELMLVCDIFDPDLRLRSLDIAAVQWRHG